MVATPFDDVRRTTDSPAAPFADQQLTPTGTSWQLDEFFKDAAGGPTPGCLLSPTGRPVPSHDVVKRTKAWASAWWSTPRRSPTRGGACRRFRGRARGARR